MRSEHQQADEQEKFTEQLDAERQRLVRAQAVAKVGSWETDLVTLGVTWSAETFRIFDVDPAIFQPTHERFLALVHPGDRASVSDAFNRSSESREICTIEHRILARDGRTKIISERWQTFLDQDGAPSFAVGTCQDLTEMKMVEAKAREATYQLRVASDVASLGAWSYTVGGDHVLWSDQTAIIHDMPSGFTPTVAEAIVFYAPEYREKIQSAFAACIERGQQFNETLEIITAKGRRIWVRAIGEAVRD